MGCTRPPAKTNVAVELIRRAIRYVKEAALGIGRNATGNCACAVSSCNGSTGGIRGDRCSFQWESTPPELAFAEKASRTPKGEGRSDCGFCV